MARFGLLLLNNGNWNTIIEWTDSSQINTDGTNTIGVLAKGTSFTFFINGEQVDQADDSTLKSGKVGIALALHNAGDKMQIVHTNYNAYIKEGGKRSMAETRRTIRKGDLVLLEGKYANDEDLAPSSDLHIRIDLPLEEIRKQSVDKGARLE